MVRKPAYAASKGGTELIPYVTLHFRVWCGPASVCFRNRGIITVLICEQNCPILYHGFRASVRAIQYGVPLASRQCAGTNHSLSPMLVQFWLLVRLSLGKFVMNFHYFGKIQGFHINSLFTLHFFYLLIMNLKYFVTSRHHSGALILSMKQISNYLLEKLLEAYHCFKQDKDWNIFRNFHFLDTDLAWVVYQISKTTMSQDCDP